ncbi:MAG TPA: GNAT family N-acetyltransferase [Propionibacteriaceae bacterium]|nr:GNAT family N-acetyltransferase [Propionibacteriaceae bacterium]
MNWFPDDWAHPTRVELSTGHHLRPIRAADVDLDMPAVMGSRERLWSIFGATWGWPPASLTWEQDRLDLQRHEEETEAHQSFNYAIFDEHETELIGCIYIDPTAVADVDAEISWWVRDEYVASALEAELESFVPRWIERDWPLHRPCFQSARPSSPDRD